MTRRPGGGARAGLVALALVAMTAWPAGPVGAIQAAAPVTGADDAVLAVDHPTLPLRYAVDREVTRGRVPVRVEGTGGGVQQVVEIGAAMSPRSVAIDSAGTRLYVAVHTHTHVLDLSDPTRPTVVGRMADHAVRNHESVQVVDLADPVMGLRTVLVVGSRLGGGGGCWTGRLHLYDITGAQADAPVTVGTSDVPATGGASCPAAHVELAGRDRRLRVVWEDGGLVRRDSLPYDTTAAFRALAGVCVIVR